MNELEKQGSGDAVQAIIDESMNVEALAQLVEKLDADEKLARKLNSSFRNLQLQVNQIRSVIREVQKELRDVICDVALTKRALISLGQRGVADRESLKHELIKELLPPRDPRRVGLGMQVNIGGGNTDSKVDCENRLHLCKAACCRIFEINLTSEEVNSGQYNWDSNRPYSLCKTNVGCSNIASGGCKCKIYDSRPSVCRSYDCSMDKRIWQDFDRMILNPDLQNNLQKLNVEVELERKPNPSSTQDLVESVGFSVNAKNSHVKKLRSSQSPPDFSALREMNVPKPLKPFKPNSKLADEK